MSETLKPCPFCGKEVRMGTDGGSHGYKSPTRWVGCLSCDFKLPAHDATYYVWEGPDRGTHDCRAEAETNAAAAWNRRTP